MRRCAVVAFAAAALALSLGTAGAPAAQPALRIVVAAQPGRTAAAERAVAGLHGAVTRSLPLIGGFAARVPAAAVPRLRADASVRSVARDTRLGATSLADDCPTLAATCFDTLAPNVAWQDAVRLGSVPRRWNGEGVTVAVLDTGVTPTADLDAADGTSRVLARVDLTADHDGLDRFGHGTHMIGLVAGNGAASHETYTGAAPDANVVSVKVAGWDGATDVSTVIAGLQWIVAHRDQYGIRIVNLSYGTDSTQAPSIDPLDEAVERAWRAGILVVTSAGNRGLLGGGVTKPGDDPSVLTVGAADVNGTAVTADDSVAPFSSRGGGKPDLLAPGVSIVSERAPGSTLDALHPLARVDASYFKGTGTSQAAAIVSGIAARVLEADPALTPDQLEALLIQTANPTLAQTPGAGAGLADAAAAVALAVQLRGGTATIAPPAPRSPSTGTGSLDASRGTQHVVGDLAGNGTPEPLSGEIDALGRPWDASVSATRWTPDGWAASPWAARTAAVAGWSPAPPWAGPAAGVLAWSSNYWGANYWGSAAWLSNYWGANYWGANYWGAAEWQ